MLPLSDHLRREANATDALDVFLCGLVFFDVVFTGLDQPPTLGTEVWTKGFATGPGGIANFAVALRRLGLRTQLAAAFGTDLLGANCWEVLAEQEGIDLTRSRRFEGWPTPVTASLAYGGDRALVTHGLACPVSNDELVGDPPPSRATVVHLEAEATAWLPKAAAGGSLVFADVGWDPSETWAASTLEQLAMCHAFMPNEEEATRYTRTSTPHEALAKLADLVPFAVVTCGASGAIAVDATTGETAEVGGLEIGAIDATGAGDVFGASLVVATLEGWPLEDRLRFANLAAALSVRHAGGAMASPRWDDIARWWRAVNTRDDAAELRAEYAFLSDVVAQHLRMG
ncbi:MAG: hypothetical protein QOJ62_917 [Actinomycetota bacterium]|nr:hypothetical protein [Actinomycetota bacterium]